MHLSVDAGSSVFVCHQVLFLSQGDILWAIADITGNIAGLIRSINGDDVSLFTANSGVQMVGWH